MMPDLGRYALEVSAAYVGSLAMLAALVGWVWWRGLRTRRALEAVEMRAKRQ
ncbi:MAG: heme exporter protein CcmD [Pararhodobacter sp.]|nr:heme exporter protein CcmD [Pararhodobacter sp.]